MNRRESLKDYVSSVDFIDLEKRYKPSKHYVYVINVNWSDERTFTIYRKYSDFFDFHVELVETFPTEAGKYKANKRVIPELPDISGGKLRQKHKQASRLVDSLDAYCKTLLKLDSRISHHFWVSTFFQANVADLKPPKSPRNKREKKMMAILSPTAKKDGKQISAIYLEGEDGEDDMCISGPLVLQTYRVIGCYSADDKGEVSLQEDELVEVVEKHDNGWWFVQVEDRQGWAPASFLEPYDQDRETDEAEPLQNFEPHLVLQDYEAALPDEVSMRCGAIVNVMHKLLAGWWIIHHNNTLGYAPATYLTPYTYYESDNTSPNTLQVITSDQALSTCSLPQRVSTVRKPVQRRCTFDTKSSSQLRSKPKWDMESYRQMSVRMSQKHTRVRNGKKGEQTSLTDTDTADEDWRQTMTEAAEPVVLLPVPKVAHRKVEERPRTKQHHGYENVEDRDYTILSEKQLKDDSEVDADYVNIPAEASSSPKSSPHDRQPPLRKEMVEIHRSPKSPTSDHSEESGMKEPGILSADLQMSQTAQTDKTAERRPHPDTPIPASRFKAKSTAFAEKIAIFENT